jgi:hypothetical protein
LGDDIDPALMIDKAWTFLVVIEFYLATPRESSCFQKSEIETENLKGDKPPLVSEIINLISEFDIVYNSGEEVLQVALGEDCSSFSILHKQSRISLFLYPYQSAY